MNFIGSFISMLKEKRLWYIFCTAICFLLILPLFGLYIDGNLLFPYCLYLMFFLVAAALSWYAEGQGTNLLTVSAVSFLIATGALVQSVLKATSSSTGTTDSWSENLIIIAIVAIVFCSAFILLRNTVLRMLGGYVVWITGAIALGCLGFCLLTEGVNGAKNWASVGGMSLQLTEIVKFFGVLFLGGVLLTEYSDKAKFWIMTIFTGITAVILMVFINEMGTMMVIGLVYIALVFGYIKSWPCKLILVIALALMVGLFAYFYSNVNTVSCHWVCHQGCTDEITVEKKDEKGEVLKDKEGNPIKETVSIPHIVTGKSGKYCDKCLKLGKYTHVKELDPTFVCSFCSFTKFDRTQEEYNALYERTYNEVTGWSQGKLCEKCSDNLFIGILKGKATKIYQRFAVWLDYDKAENMDFAQQIRDGIKATKLGGVFGTTESFGLSIINPYNDSVVVAVAYRMGMLWVMLILLAYYILFLGIRISRSPIKTGAILALCIQTLVVYAGNFNFFALTGIGVPLISSGGSIFAVSLAFVFIIYTRDSRCKKEKAVREEA